MKGGRQGNGEGGKSRESDGDRSERGERDEGVGWGIEGGDSSREERRGRRGTGRSEKGGMEGERERVREIGNGRDIWRKSIHFICMCLSYIIFFTLSLVRIFFNLI